MTNQNAQIYVKSTINVTDRLKAYGKGDIMEISLLKLCYKYACYANDYESLQKIDKIISELQMKDNDICLNFSDSAYALSNPSASEPGGSTPIDNTNTAPTVSANTVTIGVSDIDYTFTISDFTKDFADAENNGIGKIVIKSLPTQPLLYNDIQVMIGQVVASPSLLVYDRVGSGAYVDSFNFSIFDDYLDDPKESIDTLMTVDVLLAANQPATIGDNIVYSDNRFVTVLTLAMFTTGLVAPYNDPEGDLIDAIRIDEISNVNNGLYQLNDVNVQPGDIITREQLNAGEFKHVGPAIDTATSDTINFSARDEGSLIWVQ
jgi:hypothetical protein